MTLPIVPTNLVNLIKLREFLEEFRNTLVVEGGGGIGAQGAQGAQGLPESASLASTTAGNTTNTLTTVFTHTGSVGLTGGGSIKNTGSNTLTIRRTVTDNYGVTDNQEDPVIAGASLTWSMETAIGTALPEFVSFAVAVKSTVTDNHTTFSVRHTSHGT